MELDEVKIVYSSEEAELESNTDKLISTFQRLSNMLDKVTASFKSAIDTAGSFDSLIQKIEESSSAIESASMNWSKFSTSMAAASIASGNVTQAMEEAYKATDDFNDEMKELEEQSNKSGRSLLSTARILSTFGFVSKKIIDFTKNSADAIATQIKFNSAFNETEGELERATQWVDEFSNALYLDSKQVQGLAAKMKILSRNLGVNNELSNKMSENLTKVAYDLAAINNVDVEQVMRGFQSGLSGQAKALQNYGVAINQATLQNTLYANGINRTVSSLNSAEKAYLVYYQIMSTTASQQGYLAKTLLTPANALSIIKTQFGLLAREIGNVFIPVLMAAVPVIMLLTNALRALAQAIARLFGINIDFSKYATDLGSISGGIDGIGDSAQGAAKKMKNMLRDFDELHVVDFGNDTGGGSGVGAGGGIGFELPQIDYAGNLGVVDKIKEKVRELLEYLKPFVPLLSTIAFVLAALGLEKLWGTLVKVTEKVIGLFDVLMNNHPILAFVLGIGAIVTGLWLFRDGTQGLMEGDYSIANFAKAIGGLALTIFGATLVLGAIIRVTTGTTVSFAALLKVTAPLVLAIAALSIFGRAMDIAFQDWTGASKALAVASFALAAALLVVFIAGAPLLAAIIGIIGGIVLLIGYIREFAINMGWLKEDTKKKNDDILDSYNKTFDTISSLVSTATDDISDYGKEVNNSFSTANSASEKYDDYMNKVLGTDISKYLDNSEKDFNDYEKNVDSYLKALNIDTDKDLSKLTNVFESKTTKIQTQGTTAFRNLQETIGSSMGETTKSVADNANAISKSAEDMSKSISKYTDDSKKSFLSLSNLHIPTPHFRIHYEAVGRSYRKSSRKDGTSGTSSLSN